MEPKTKRQCLVEFSTSQIELVNDESERQRHSYQLQNRGPNSLRVRAAIAAESDPVFRLLSGSEEKYVAPGLKLPVVLQYSPANPGSHQGSLEVFVNADLSLTVPIIAHPPSSKLYLKQSVIDVGGLVTDHQIHTTSFSLSNTGSLVGTFFIDTSSLPTWISLEPVHGQLEPNETAEIQIKMLCKEEMVFSYNLRIYSSKEEATNITNVIESPLCLTLCGHLQHRSLRLIDPHTNTPLECVTFEPTYYDTETSRRVLLYNDCPVSTEYLCLLDKTARGSEEEGVSEGETMAMACTEGGPGQGRWREQGTASAAEKLIRVEPAQDSLLPFEKRAVELTFAPTFVPSGSGWDHFQATPTRRDYTLFIRFMAITNRDKKLSSADLEVAICASALPVDVVLEPSTPLEFGASPTMHPTTLQLKMHNISDTLPLHFITHRLPHYTCHPPTGHIPPSHTHTLSITFTPKQLGPLNTRLMIDITAPNTRSMSNSGGGVVKSLVVELKGEGVGRGEVWSQREREGRRAMSHAHPDDLATSIRPYDGSPVFTPYTHTSRYTYVDRDYAYSERDRRQVQRHKDYYLQYLRERQAHRQWMKKEITLSNAARGPDSDLGMLTLNAPSNSPTVAGSPSKRGWRRRRGKKEKEGSGGIMTTDDLLHNTSIELREVEVCSSLPDSAERVNEVTRHLSPHQLTLINMSPGVLDYGVIAVGSVMEKTLTVKNNLNQYISIIFKLSGSSVHYQSSTTISSPSSLTLYLPPSSYTRLPLTMKHTRQGVLERCVECCVNGQHIIRLPVLVKTVPLSLTLSTHTLTLTQPHMATPIAGLRGYVEVTNDLNVPANFQWHAREGVDTTVFYMVHPNGVVPAYSSLRCEFVCLPTHDSADSALFRLVVVGEEGERWGGDVYTSDIHNDNFLTLNAELGHPVCSFQEQRILFGSVPLGLTTTRTVHLTNNGHYHAYFQVLNPEPCSGMMVHPKSGCVPVGGACDLKLHLHPVSVTLFDTELVVMVRGGRKLKLKLVGAAEKPKVTIDRESFIFGGVYCGSKSSLPFTVSNTGSTRCELLFDFSFLSDFSVTLPSQTSPYAEIVSETSNDLPGIYTLQLPAKTSTQCHLTLSPKDVAAYDFQLPVLVNGSRPPSPPPSPWPPSSQHPTKITTHSQSQHNMGQKKVALGSYENTPCRRVLATAVRAPLTLSLSLFSFNFPVGYLETMTEPAIHSKSTELKNVGNSPLKWTLLTSGIKRIEDKTFGFILPSGASLLLPPDDSVSSGSGVGEVGYLAPQESFKFTVQCSPSHHGDFTADVPLHLQAIDDSSSPDPYCTISLRATVPVGKITMSTESILLQPVPLDITISAQYTLLVQDFPNPVDIEVVVPFTPNAASLVVRLPKGGHVTDCRQDTNSDGDDIKGVELPVVIEFTSSQPLTLTGYLIFRDTNSGKSTKVAYALAADNSVLSVAQFLAQSVAISSVQLNSQHIPMLNVNSVSGTAVVSTSSAVSLAASQTRYLSNTPLTTSLSGDLSYSDIFMQECVNAVCRWLSGYGWGEGIKHITSPTDLRERVGHDVPKRGTKQRSSIRVQRGMLVELITRLCGRLPPGIPMNPPPCTTPSEMINQQYSTLITILTFLKNQGGELWCLTPDSLLDYRDYQQWLLDCQPSPSPLPPTSTEEEFQDRSTQAWTYLLLLIVKVLVLPRVIRRVPSYLRETVSSLDNQSSNVYSQPERVILAWLNYHYQQQKNTVLRCDDDEYIREVVSFDMDLMDCTVLACVLSAYCPFLVSSHFTGLYTHPTSAEQCSHNALILINALTYVGITYDCQASDLNTPTPVFLLLLCCHLYQCLPSLSPTRTVLCEGLLHSDIRQQITLDNPSSKPLIYRALLRGENANNFSLAGASDTITIDGRKSASIEVKFRGHQIRPCDAVLLLVAESGRGTSVAFQLQGRVTGVKPQSQVQVTTSLYQIQSVYLSVTSHFKTAASFDVHLYESTDESLLNTFSPNNRRKMATRSLGIIPATALQSRSTDNMTAFNPQTNQVHLEPGDHSTTVTLTFVPLKMERRHCVIILRNDNVGEIILSVKATVQLPFPTLPQTSKETDSHFFTHTDTQTLHLKAYVGESVNEDLLLSSDNPALERAVLEVCGWSMSDVELKRRLLTNSMKHAALETAMNCLEINQKTMTATDGIQPDFDKLVFRVDGANDYFKLPSMITVPAHKGGAARFPVQFIADVPGQYECHVVLVSAHDVRMFIIECTVLARGTQAQLEFTTTAMQPLTQDIPIVNPSTVEWPLKAILKGSGFIGPDSLLSQPLSTTYFSLTFNPKKEGQVEGELCLVNSNDGTEHRFQLSGVAEKPLAHDHIILHAQAKTSLMHILHVPNHNERTTEFHVESDLTCISGPPSISITGGDLVDYPLLIKPIRRGLLSGVVAFVAQAPATTDRHSLSTPSTQRDGSTPHHVWFQLEVRVDPAPPDHVIPITCPTLSSTISHLPITNTQPQPLQLTVLVDGACISGPDTLTVEANSVSNYPLTFAPTLIGDTTAQVVFDGGPDGEFWYQLQLSAVDPDPVTLPDIICELGNTTQVNIPLNNPLDNSVILSCECSNTKHFIIPALTDSKVAVEVGGSVEVTVLFKPSSVGSGEHVAHISFTSQQFGTQVFILQGRGSEPSLMPPTNIIASLNSNTTHIISFTNPLDTPAHFHVTLTGNKASENFCLLMKRTHVILLHPGVSLDIPIMFVPETMHTHHTTVVVSTEAVRGGRERGGSNEHRSRLTWQYPVIGQPEFRPVSPKSAPQITCRAKGRVEERLEVVLVGCKMNKAAIFRPITPNQGSTTTSPISPIEPPSNSSDGYMYEMVCSDEECSDVVRDCVGVKLLRKIIDEDDTVKLVFKIVFVPPRALSCTAELNVRSSDGGGVWKFPVQLSAGMADPDDVIIIEAAGLNKESQIQFRLTSMKEHPLKFTAHLSDGSDPAITVSPMSGELAPLNSRGTLFFISYKPLSYGRLHKARLIVQCQLSEWCYEIVGQPPQYSPPTDTPARVQHRATPPLLLTQTRKNFIRENIKLSTCRQPVH